MPDSVSGCIGTISYWQPVSASPTARVSSGIEPQVRLLRLTDSVETVHDVQRRACRLLYYWRADCMPGSVSGSIGTVALWQRISASSTTRLSSGIEPK